MADIFISYKRERRAAARHLEHARATYSEIGATGWLRRLDSFVSTGSSSGRAEHIGRPA